MAKGKGFTPGLAGGGGELVAAGQRGVARCVHLGESAGDGGHNYAFRGAAGV